MDKLGEKESAIAPIEPQTPRVCVISPTHTHRNPVGAIHRNQLTPFRQANGEAVLAVANPADSAHITTLPQTETTQAGETSTPQ